MNRMQHTRPCAGCGKMMYNVGNQRKYCPECCRNRHNASNRKWRRLAPGPSRGTGRCGRQTQKAAMTRCWQMSGPPTPPV